ncbi:MAG: hypothetical protein H0X51_01505 [Parachlamydiaceae bacterium]|nr:hypothetical protein [Parachlamydiaceae bacterium]
MQFHFRQTATTRQLYPWSNYLAARQVKKQRLLSPQRSELSSQQLSMGKKAVDLLPDTPEEDLILYVIDQNLNRTLLP